MEIKNAKITGTTLGFEDHGVFTCWIHLDYGGISQSFGGYFLEAHPDMIQKILNTIGVESWEDLQGKYIRVESDSGGIYKIGHLLKDVWYSPKTE